MNLLVAHMPKTNRLNPVKWVRDINERVPHFFTPFEAHNDTFGNVIVSVNKSPYGFGKIMVEVKNKFNKVLGTEWLEINKKTGRVDGVNICVEPEYSGNGKKKGFGIGELLRLASIMLMKENKCKDFNIYSKNSALYFHSKYKFEPNISSTSEMLRPLEAMIKNSNPECQEFTKRAKSLYDRVLQSPHNNFFKEINSLTKEYIEKGLQEPSIGKKHKFDLGFDMVLKSESLEKYKDFYNQLFKKHGVDYQL